MYPLSWTEVCAKRETSKSEMITTEIAMSWTGKHAHLSRGGADITWSKTTSDHPRPRNRGTPIKRDFPGGDGAAMAGRVSSSKCASMPAQLKSSIPKFKPLSQETSHGRNGIRRLRVYVRILRKCCPDTPDATPDSPGQAEEIAIKVFQVGLASVEACICLYGSFEHFPYVKAMEMNPSLLARSSSLSYE